MARPKLYDNVPCSACDHNQATRQGRCETCYRYWKRTGKEREPGGRRKPVVELNIAHFERMMMRKIIRKRFGR